MTWKHSTAVVVLLALSAIACIADQREAAMEARRAYRECLEANSGDRERCSQLEEEYRWRVEEYEKAASEAWSCDLTTDRCKGPLDPG